MFFRQAAAGGAADLHGLEFRAVLQSAAHVEDDLTQSRTHGNFDQAGVFNGAGEGEGLAAGAAGGADGLKPVRALQNDLGDVGIGFHVVQHRGLLPQTLFYGSGGLGSGHAAAALDGSGQCGAFAADERARAPVDVHMEGEVGAEDVVTQQSPFLQLGNGVAQPCHGHGVFRADVDVAVFRTDGVSGDHHALDELEGVAFHNGAVHKRAGVALVAVADHIAHGLLLTGDLLPLPSGGEAAAAAAAQAGAVHFVDDLVPGHGEHGLLQRVKAAGGQILVQGFGVELAAVFQNNPGLLRDEGNFIGLNVDLFALLVEQALDDLVAQNALFHDLGAVLGLNLYVLNDLVALLDTHQRAKLAESLTARLLDADDRLAVVAAAGREHQLDAGGLLYQIFKQLMDLMGAGRDTAGAGADQNPAGIALNLQLRLNAGLIQFFTSSDHQPFPLNSAINANAFSGVMEGCTCSLTIMVGARPQAPRQDTVSTVKSISSVVCFFLLSPSSFQSASRTGVEWRTWQAVPSQTLMTYLPFASKEKFS